MINEIKQDAEARMEKASKRCVGILQKSVQVVHNQAY